VFPRADGPVLNFSAVSKHGVSIGRDDSCEIQLAGDEVSRRHASAHRDGPVVVLVDLDSRNGTFVNGERIRQAPLCPQDVVRIGGHVGVVTSLTGPFGSLAPGLFAGPRLRAVLEPVWIAAKSDLPIVIEGETGTGKEVLARAIHAVSGRSGPFNAINCAAVPEALAEGELFGYRQGAFTGAVRASPGLFRGAQHGTLLLDEICELPLSLQAKLLRALEQGEVQPLGEIRPVRVDVRVVAAAQEPLGDAVNAARFRADLWARLDGLTVRLPPLRERREEVPYLFALTLAELRRDRPIAVDAKLVERLCLYDWPLNVRELVQVVRRLQVLHGHEPRLRASFLPSRIAGVAVGTARQEDPETELALEYRALPDLEMLVSALRAAKGNLTLAARTLGISRQRAYRMIHEQGELDLKSLREGLERGAHSA
jgi:transcriptional regulator with PAS, ATPase and Fis domain